MMEKKQITRTFDRSICPPYEYMSIEDFFKWVKTEKTQMIKHFFKNPRYKWESYKVRVKFGMDYGYYGEESLEVKFKIDCARTETDEECKKREEKNAKQKANREKQAEAKRKRKAKQKANREKQAEAKRKRKEEKDKKEYERLKKKFESENQ